MLDHDTWLLRQAEDNCHESGVDEVDIVKGFIDRYSLGDAQETFEAHVTDIVKVMTEKELKVLLVRFLEKGDSDNYIRLELENMES